MPQSACEQACRADRRGCPSTGSLRQGSGRALRRCSGRPFDKAQGRPSAKSNGGPRLFGGRRLHGWVFYRRVEAAASLSCRPVFFIAVRPLQRGTKHVYRGLPLFEIRGISLRSHEKPRTSEPRGPRCLAQLKSAPKERYILAHGVSRGTRIRRPSPCPSPARAGEGRRRRGEGHSSRASALGYDISPPSGLSEARPNPAVIYQRTRAPAGSASIMAPALSSTI